MEAMMVITVTALDKNAGVTEALRIHLPSHVVQVNSWLRGKMDGPDIRNITFRKKRSFTLCATCSHTFANVSTGVLNCGIAINVGQQSKTEAVPVVRGVGEAVHEHAG